MTAVRTVDVNQLGDTFNEVAIATDAALTPVGPQKKSRTSAGGIASRERRILNQPGFVLHSWPYKETSLIVEIFTRDYGRIALVAKGAKRPHSQLRSVLQTFQPLQLGWTGKSEIRVMTGADWVGGMLPLERSALLCGFYLNELLVKFLVRDEPHTALFEQYISTLNLLAHDEPASVVLRQFELALLRESGLLGDLTFCTVSGSKVDAVLNYVVDPEVGTRLATAADNIPVVVGKTLLDMAQADYADTLTQFQSKMLMRFLLGYHLHGASLNTRQILIDLQNL